MIRPSVDMLGLCYKTEDRSAEGKLGNLACWVPRTTVREQEGPPNLREDGRYKCAGCMYQDIEHTLHASLDLHLLRWNVLRWVWPLIPYVVSGGEVV